MTKIYICLIFIFFSKLYANINDFNVAVSSNFLLTFNSISAFIERDCKIKINVCSDSTVNLYNKILNNAPFNVFISADSFHPLLLEKNFSKKSYFFTYGFLVFFGRQFILKKNFIRKIENFERILISNKNVSPYGLASFLIINNLNIYSKNYIFTQNINQNYNLLNLNDNDNGFVSLSYMKHLNYNFLYWEIPYYIYSLIEQRFIILINDFNSNCFYNHFTSKKILDLIEKYGYKNNKP